MTFIPSSPEKLHQEATQGGAAVSESLLSTVGGVTNFILDNFTRYDFGVFGGSMSGLSTYPFTFQGSIESVLFKSVIEKIIIFNEITGSASQTEFYIEKQLAAGGVWTNILSQNGIISNTAADGVYADTTLTAPAGVTLPIVSDAGLEINDKLRFVLASAATGAQNLSVKIITRPIT